LLKAKRKISKAWNGSAWSGDGLPPTASQKAILDGNLTLPYVVEAIEYSSLEGCECEVKSGTFIVGNEEGTTPGTLYLQGALKNAGGTIVFNDNSSLLQEDNLAVNQGTVSIKRTTQPMFRQDFTYWSSPLTLDSNFKLGGNPISLSPDTHPTKYYKWKHAAPSQAWEAIINGNEAMHPGRGYIVRAPESFDIEGAPDAEADTYTATFVGNPNNGIVTHAVTGHPTTSKWNLLGNPYPSALNIETFLAANSDYLDGTIYLWTHNSPVQENTATGFYQYSPNDYAAFNFSGATATTSAALTGGPTPNEFLASGQAFFVKGLSSGTITFDNSMRATGNNNLFFKPLPPQPIDNWELTGKHRIWLNITGPDAFNQTLIGYIQNATNGVDWGYDGPHFGGNKVSFYSIVADKNLAIQGRALPFNNQDQVPLGYKTSLTGDLTIEIDHFDGLFEGQDIYLEDLLLHIVHDLKEGPYTFTTASGTYNNRFLLRYLPEETLGKANPTAVTNDVIVYKRDNQIIIKSVSEALEEIQLYDLLGRTVFEKQKLKQYEFGIQNIVMEEQLLIVKVKLANGLVVNKKIIH
jgi:hypothetical protein